MGYYFEIFYLNILIVVILFYETKYLKYISCSNYQRLLLKSHLASFSVLCSNHLLKIVFQYCRNPCYCRQNSPSTVV